MARRIAWAALLAVTLAACGRVEDTAAPPTPLESFDPGARLVEAWSGSTGDAFNRRWIRLIPFVSGDAVYTLNVAGQVTAWDRERGRRLWRSEAGSWVSGGLGGGDGRVYAGTRDGVLIAWSMDDGAELWRRPMGGELLTPAGVGPGLVVVRTVDGRIVALNPEDGSRRWSFSYSVPSLSLRGGSTPIVVTGGVVAGLDDGRMIALDEDSGEAIWQVTIAEPAGRSPIERMVDVDGRIAIGFGTVYAASYQGRVVKVDPRDGRLLWAQELSSYAGLAVSDTEERVYVTDADSHVLALNPDTGALLWRQERLAHRGLSAPIPVPDSNWLVVVDSEGYVHLLSRGDGRIVARHRLGGRWGVLSTPVVDDDGRIYVQGRDGRLTALDAQPID